MKKYLIVGSGITGTLLAWKFYQYQIPFELWSDSNLSTASYVAAGLINPITGKRLAKLENYEYLLSIALNTYQELEHYFGIKFIYPYKIYRFLENPELLYHFEQKTKLPDFQNYLRMEKKFPYKTLNAIGDFMVIEPAYRIRWSLLFDLLHNIFQKKGLMVYRYFDEEQEYTDYDKIFLCRGYYESYSTLFPDLKWEYALGEVIVFYSKELELNDIYQNQKLTIVPLGDDYYWLGATYLRTMNEFNYQATKELENFLESQLKVSYTVIKKEIGVRPILKERKPIFLQCSTNPKLYLLNGMGSKGSLWVPYWVEKVFHECKSKILC